MKKTTLIVAALFCAVILTAGIASAGNKGSKGKGTPAQSGRVSGPVAGFSTNLAVPQPNTSATLETGANRLIRWQGWLDVDAFSASVLSQMQKQLEAGVIETGKFTVDEPSIAEAVAQAEREVSGFRMNENLDADGENFRGEPRFYVWTYRHNYTDTGLYQLYVSVRGKILIGRGFGPPRDGDDPVWHKDIQSLNYEFGPDGLKGWKEPPVPRDIYADVEIWRGAVVEVSSKGELTVAGNEGGVVTLDGNVDEAPVALWERAPRLIDNAGASINPVYNPKCATGADYAHPLDRAIRIDSNVAMKRSGDVQKEGRVRTFSTFGFRRAGVL